MTSEDDLDVTISDVKNPQDRAKEHCTVVLNLGPHRESLDMGQMGGGPYLVQIGEILPMWHTSTDILTYLVQIGNASISAINGEKQYSTVTVATVQYYCYSVICLARGSLHQPISSQTA